MLRRCKCRVLPVHVVILCYYMYLSSNKMIASDATTFDFTISLAYLLLPEGLPPTLEKYIESAEFNLDSHVCSETWTNVY